MQLIDFNHFVADILRQMKPIAESHNVDLRLEPSGAVYVDGEPDHLRMLFLNLLTNAIKCNYANGRVVVTIELRKQWVVVHIADNGMGIPETEQQQIFNRFHRATETGSRDGKGGGLGLSIANTIVKAHKGCIEVESAIKQGTTFRVFLPTSF